MVCGSADALACSSNSDFTLTSLPLRAELAAGGLAG
jgi:hypothetical protein